MSNPQRSIRLLGRSESSLNNISTSDGEIFYDTTNQSLRVSTRTGFDILASKEYIDTAIGNIDLSVIELSGIATESYVTTAISNIPPVNLSGLATESYVTTAISNIPPVNLSGLATESYVTTAIETATAPDVLFSVTEFREKAVESKLATVMYTVTVTGPQGSDVGNKYRLNAVYRPEINFVAGYTYVFVQDDATNVFFPNANGTTPNPHPLNFSADNLSGELASGTSYLTDVRYFLNGASVTQAVYNSPAFNTATSRQVWITVTNSTPATLYYWCYNHTAMGNEIAVTNPGAVTAAPTLVTLEDVTIANPSDGQVLKYNSSTAQWINASDLTGDGGAGLGLSVLSVTVAAASGSGNLSYSNTTGVFTFTPPSFSISSLGFAQGVVIDQFSIDDTMADNANDAVPVESAVRGYVDRRLGFDHDGVPVPEIVKIGPGVATNSFTTIAVSEQDSVAADSATDTLTLAAGTGISITTNATTDTITVTNSSPNVSQNVFTTIAVSGQNNVIADSSTDTLTLAAGSNISITTDAVTDTITITATALEGTSSDSFTTIAVSGQSNVVADNSADTLTLAAGTGIAITTNATTDTVTITNSSPNIVQNVFSTVAVAGQNNVVADSGTDTLTLVAGSNITITTNDSTDTITIAAAGGGSTSDSFTTIAVAGQSNVVADSSTDTLTLVAGTGIAITTDATTDAITITNTGGGETNQNAFSNVAVSGQSTVEADSTTDTLTLAAGTGISITTNATTDTVTITSTVSSGATAFTGLSDSAGLTVDRFYLPAITMLSTTNNGASSYRFDQYGVTDNPTVYALNGATIAFNLNVAGHPFLIQTSGGANYNEGLTHVTTAGVVTTGSSAQGQTSGTLYWKIPTAISGNYRYICSIHGAMVGIITIKAFSAI